ncbi:MAG TPA: DUF2628 domain-containing protein [Firmicutes bacterium]|nr:DUF2628 domain-containing protein [Bacillota bacterium]
MRNVQDFACPVCGKPFVSGDDVVVCPLCGAPHHRECYKKIGRCAFASAHGTAAQWRPPLKKEDEGVWTCGNCGTVNPAGSEACRKCGRAFEEPAPPRPEEQNPPVDPAVFAPPYTPYGEVPSDGTVGGESAMELATYLGPRAGYYLPRFQYIAQGRNPVSWNWAAALFPVEWLLYRKMGKLFVPALFLSLLLLSPYLAALALGMRAVLADSSALQAFLAAGEIPAGSVPAWLLLLAHLSSLVSLTLRCALGMRANSLYWRHVKRMMGRIRRECREDGDSLVYRYALSGRGGVSAARVVLYWGVLAAVLLAPLAAWLLW